MSNTLDSSPPEAEPRLRVETNVLHPGFDEPIEPLCRAARVAAASRGCTRGTIEIAVVDDARIHEINRLHLRHDWPTDVISFPYFCQRERVEGELVVSWDTARREAEAAGWDAPSELLLYVVHGVLHLTGMDDTEPEDRQAMRRAERAVLYRLGLPEVDRCGVDATDAPRDDGDG